MADRRDDHEAIRDFLKRKAAGGADRTGKKMKYDPQLKRFVIVHATDNAADELPEVTAEDLQAF